MTNGDIKVQRFGSNQVGYYDSLKRLELLPKFNYLLSMNVFESLPVDGKDYSLVEYLKSIKDKYLDNRAYSVIVRHIDSFITA